MAAGEPWAWRGRLTDVGGGAKATREASVMTVLWSRPWLVGAAGPGSTSPSLSRKRARFTACPVWESAARGLSSQGERSSWLDMSKRARLVVCPVKESTARGLSGQGK